MFPVHYTARRKELEDRALSLICACWYYDLADCMSEMSDDELEDIIANDGVDCPDCDQQYVLSMTIKGSNM